MPAAQWPEPVAVIQQLLEAPQGFDFFQALHLLERWWAREEGLSRTQMLATRVAFRNSLSLSFPASEIESLRTVWRDLKSVAGDTTNQTFQINSSSRGTGLGSTADSDSNSETNAATSAPPTEQPFGIDTRQVQRLEITPAFIGLLGSSGALPAYYTELLAHRETYEKDYAARAFMDIFLHRAVALFYQAWRKHRLALQFESDRRNQFLPLVLAVVGIGHPGLRDRLHPRDGSVADDALAYFAGALHRRPVSAQVMQQVLAHYFRVPVQLTQFVGRWFTLPQRNQSVLGFGNTALGSSAVLGERVWQRDLRMRVTLGPLTGERFRRFLPGGAGAVALRDMLQMLAGPTLEYEVRLELKAEDVQGITLWKDSVVTDTVNALGVPVVARSAHLGWDSFLLTQPQTGARADAGYDLLALT